MGLIYIFKYQNLFIQIGVVLQRRYPGILYLFQMIVQNIFGMPLLETSLKIAYWPHKRLHHHFLQYSFPLSQLVWVHF